MRYGSLQATTLVAIVRIGRVMRKFARQLEGSTNLGEMKTISIPKSLTTDPLFSVLAQGSRVVRKDE